MSQIGQPMKTADLYDQPPPPEAAASAAPPANDQLYEQPPPVDDGKQSTARTKSEEVQRPTTNPTQKGEYENIDDMQVSFLGSVKGKKKAGKQKGKKHGKSDTPKGQTASAQKKPAKKNIEVEQPVVKVQPKPQPKPKKKVVVKNKCCCVFLSFLTLLSFALALVTSLAAFCQLEETIPKEYPWF
uniref:Uncharacterized protein n=1 Tax=Meloidogyne enterolobii TaxID=390850 RepID=A0A6V7WIH8_MELEN|nr:unnamed protein product [Meloidogyne enterolobii]